VIKSVGVIGLGAMGEVIASHLLKKNFTVNGYDIVPKRADDLKSLGLDDYTNLQALADNSDILITSLPSNEALLSVINDIIQTKKKEHILLETSTLKVQEKINASQIFEEYGHTFLDAPISGTTPLVKAMKGSLFVGGDVNAYEKSIAVIEAFTATNYFVGEVGDSSKMKYLANYLVYVHTVAAAECFVLGQKAGLDPQLIHDVLKSSAGASRMLEQRGEMMAKSDYRDGSAKVFNIYKKDADIITDFAVELESPIDLFASARERYNSALALGLEDLELASVCKAIEVSAGIDRKLVEE
jgi:L-threonate 2-dehydrogenase